MEPAGRGHEKVTSMNIVGPLLRSALKPLASYLNPCGSYAPVVATNLDLLSRALLPGDVILVEGK